MDVSAKGRPYGNDAHSPRQRIATEARNHTHAKSGGDKRELRRMFASGMGNHRFMTTRSEGMNQPLIAPSSGEVHITQQRSRLPPCNPWIGP